MVVATETYAYAAEPQPVRSRRRPKVRSVKESEKQKELGQGPEMTSARRRGKEDEPFDFRPGFARPHCLCGAQAAGLFFSPTAARAPTSDL
mmetsp:Transcript_52/g.120  ORF Transcript_52/g.120 Transcript_52/m.120 type:complete len:91 (+) Transcript_52:1512-1784(+)